ncbi:C-type lectin domain family 4 member G-like isoform X2 [Neocloeon triangulifer]|nr:C-type lectin domain family 4 member G-like isoform X2 [Neocloeon triangulifer]
MRIVFNQPGETRRLVEEQNEKLREELIKLSNATNDRLDQLAKTVDQHQNQIFEIINSLKCIVARLSNLTLLNCKIYSFHQTFANWTSANEICNKNCLNLATIRDLNEAQLVAAEAQRIKKGYAWWVSAKNLGRGSEKDFLWRDGTKLELDSPMWVENGDKTQDCVRIHNWTNGKLQGYPCNSDQPFICELPSECY